MKNNLAFTLVELMITIMIIGILGAVAVPAYQKYVVKSRMSESYMVIDRMGKNQITYYLQNQEFYHQGTFNPTYLDPPMQMTEDSTWDTFGYPVSVGSHLNFYYRAVAGKLDTSATELALGPVSGIGLGHLSDSDLLTGKYFSGVKCNESPTTPTMLGAVAQADYNWTVLTAIGDLDADQGPSCTAVVRLLESSPLTNKKPAYAGGFIIFNEGN